MKPSRSYPSAYSPQLSDLVQQAVESILAGHDLDLDELADGNPELRDELQSMLPAIEVMAKLDGSDMVQVGFGSHRSGHHGAESLSGILGDFRIIRVIGRGGMGTVYEAEQLSLERPVALKVLPFASMLDERQLRRFKQEARAAAMLQHPNIVRVFAVGCDRSVHHYAMELIEGQSLAGLIKNLHEEGSATKQENGQVGRNKRRKKASTGDLLLTPRRSGIVVGLAERSNHELPEPHGENGLSHGKPTSPRVPAFYATTDSSRTSHPDSRSPVVAETQAIAALSTQYTTNRKAFYRNVAKLGIDVARALAYAHREGIVHRDIKPSNLLLDHQGKIWITDFGLAQVQVGEDITQSGDVLGTLRYMSPEQLSGEKSIDQRADIYSLGLTLYELASLQPAHGESVRQKLIRRILEEDPPRIRSIATDIPKDLETILSKATSREPRDRYQTAEEFAADLERFTQHQSVQARPSGKLELLRRWAIRNPIVACLLAAVLLLLSGISAVSASSAARLAKAAHNIQQRLYVSDMVRVQALIRNGENRKAIEILERHVPKPNDDGMRGVEWHLLRTSAESIHPIATLGHQVMAYNAVYSPNGKYLATSTWTGEVCIWNTEERTREETLNGKVNYEGRCLSMVFIPNDDRLIGACLDGVVRVWQFDPDNSDYNWNELDSLTPTPNQDLPPCASRVVVSSDGEYLAVAYTDYPYNKSTDDENEIRIGIWRLSDAKLVKILDNIFAERIDLAFSPRNDSGNHSLAATSTDGKLRIWNQADWSLERAIPVAAGESNAVAFSPDGKRLATGGGVQHPAFFRGSISIWETDRWQTIRTIQHHDDVIRSLEFSPDGKTLAVGSDDHGASLWIVDSGLCLQSWKAHSGIVKDISFSPDGTQIATASYDNLAKVWQVDRLLEPADPHKAWDDHRAYVQSVCFADQGQSLYSADAAGRVVKRDFATGKIIDELDEVPDPVAWRIQVVCSPDNQLLAVATGVEEAGRISLFEQRTGDSLGSIELSESFTHGLAFSPDSRLIAAASYDSLFVCDVQSRKQLAQIPELSHTKMVAFSPDGKELAAAAATGQTYFFDTQTFKQIRKLQTEATWGTMAIAYAPQGDVFATAGGDLRIKLWDARHRSDQPIFVFPEAASNWTGSVEFSPDGKRILSTGINGTVQVWHRELGVSVLNLQPSSNWIMTGAFAPDGRGIVIGADGVHAWKAAQSFQPPVILQPPNRPCYQAFELNAE